MSAIEILRNSLIAILTNWRSAIRIFLLPLGLLIGLFAVSAIIAIQSVTVGGQTVPMASPFLFLLFPLVVFLLFWPVVAWHRLLVLGDQPVGFAPALRFKAVLRYILNLVGLSFLSLLVVMPILAVVGPMMISDADPEAMLRGEMPPLTFVILPSIASLPVLYLGLRLCLILPGAAVGNHVGLSGSWKYTSGKGMSLPLIAVLAAAVSMVLQIVLSVIYPSLVETSRGVLTAFQFIQLIGQLLGSLFVISVMSTMFLAFVQDKEKV